MDEVESWKNEKFYKGDFQYLVKRKQKHHRKHKVKVLQGEDAYLPMRISRHLLKMTSCLLFSNTTVLLQMYSMPPSWPIWVAMAPGWGWMGRTAHHHHHCIGMTSVSFISFMRSLSCTSSLPDIFVLCKIYTEI